MAVPAVPLHHSWNQSHPKPEKPALRLGLCTYIDSIIAAEMVSNLEDEISILLSSKCGENIATRTER